MRRRVTAVLVTAAVGVCVLAPPVHAGDASAVVPTLAQVQRLYPDVHDFDIDGDDGHPALFPSCADDRWVDSTVATRQHRRGDFYVPEEDRDTVASPHTWVYRYATARKARRAMKQIRAHVESCEGRHEGVEDVSVYRVVDAPDVGDEALAFQHRHYYTFEPDDRRSVDVWVREGRSVVTVGAGKAGTYPSLRTVKALTRVTVRRIG